MFDPSITAAIDSTELKANGHVWHKSSYMKKGIVPCPGIDTEMQGGAIVISRGGFSDTNYI